MNLEDLRVFREVANEGNITKTAVNLNFVQSNVTAKMKRLEQKYETKLFYRHKHGVTLTSPGRVLLSYAEQILHLMDEAEKTLKTSGVPSGTLSLGSMETTAATRLPDILSTYHDHYPQVELSLQTGTTEELIKATLDRNIEGAFVAGGVNHPELEVTEVFAEQLILVSKENSLSSLEFDQLKDQTIIVFKSGCFYREVFETWLRSKGIRHARMMELNTLDGVIGCVKAGLGISLLTKSVADQLCKNDHIQQMRLPGEVSTISTKFINHREIVKTSAFHEFIKVIDSAAGLNIPL
ncbi:DNA-binding transcriptional LysR family regulator [Pullulanibacillus pueri]|uniref:LysR family transcriptional regulator n=1 Tax=Pullulanibacillus pueri TaxID=1437324 RepID=A0A8J3ENM7_9BACL|nr:LysR family transcriptional regulator [Pullulanibacillus pueri]MBM7683363.1 DNA-binding transcriptional LysR family regulator [Pullulanibacillus pueri]GGH86590.1 LysR family transcriptional regulator [Pullulanibacillus pueri]